MWAHSHHLQTNHGALKKKTATQCVWRTTINIPNTFYKCVQYNHDHHIHAHSINILGLILDHLVFTYRLSLTASRVGRNIVHFILHYNVSSCGWADHYLITLTTCASSTNKAPPLRLSPPTSEKCILVWCNNLLTRHSCSLKLLLSGISMWNQRLTGLCSSKDIFKVWIMQLLFHKCYGSGCMIEYASLF